MTKIKFIIPQETIDAQARAANPYDFVWVSANAGSGKTHVLTERVIRLLLEGTDPSKILCLTYTKAAAAVMQNRVFQRLSEWAVLDDEGLSKKLYDLEKCEPDAIRLEIARRLFARALETPGGLKIQTIHAFCESILHQFPLEANIAGHFEMLDDMMQTALVGEARRQLLEVASTSAHAGLAEAFATVLETAGEMGLENLLDEAVSKRHALHEFIRQTGVAETRQDVFYRHFGFDPQDSEADILSDIWPAAEFSEDVLDAVMNLRKPAKRAQDFALQLRMIKPQTTAVQLQDILRAAFLKSTGEPKNGSWVATAAVKAELPDFEDDFNRVAADIHEGLDRLKLLKLIRLNLAAFTLIDDLLSRYEKMKRNRGLLDFDDLINRTVSLLSRNGAGMWVQYKLDRGIDHILVDEAQDTSPEQWQVINMLSAEFFSGSGQRDVRRTLFAVGDEKQSIYSFQGARPEDFAATGKAVSRMAARAELSFEKVSLNFSFRSTPDVLSAVDTVFSREEAFRGLGIERQPTVHAAIRSNDAGEVEIWDMLTPEQVEEVEDWRTPIDQLPAPAVKLAEQIATTIRHWLDTGEPIHGKGRRMEPRDIMVLVRKRDLFMPALSRALKNRGVPVAGADRLRLTSHIGIKDLMAVGRFVLQPADDLSLASVLKSPLFGLSEEQLYRLAQPRGTKQTLYAAMEKLGMSDAPDAGAWQVLYTKLRRWRNMADTMPVFEFYARILGQDGGRRKLLARLGPEAGDVIDEFQNYALATERSGLPGLQAFLETLEAASPEIKRELDQNRDEVRIMTVHASKGLEAAVVFMVDPGNAAWSAGRAPKLLSFDMAEPDGYEGKGFLWLPKSDFGTGFTAELLEELKTRSEEEYRRLLYVGMTRAEDRLILCGYRGERESENTWAKLASDGLGDEAVPYDHPVEGVNARRYRKTELADVVIQDKADAAETAYPPLPEHYRRPLEPEQGLPRPLTPSGASALIEADAEQVVRSGSPVLEQGVQTEGSGRSFGLQRGTVIHTLLQRLPDLPPDQRQQAAQRYLNIAAGDWHETQRGKVQAAVSTILEDPQFSSVFSPGSKAEVSLMGKLQLRGKEQVVSGQIDRICVEEDRVLIIDYKSNRPPARTMQEVPQAYITQLALYRALVEPLYPQKRVEAALLFTEGPHLIVLDEHVMEQALIALGKAI